MEDTTQTSRAVVLRTETPKAMAPLAPLKEMEQRLLLVLPRDHPFVVAVRRSILKQQQQNGWFGSVLRHLWRRQTRPWTSPHSDVTVVERTLHSAPGPAHGKEDAARVDTMVLELMAAVESEQASKLQGIKGMTTEARDDKLQCLCKQIYDGAVKMLFLPPPATLQHVFELPDLAAVRPVMVEVLGARAHHALVASKAAYDSLQSSSGGSSTQRQGTSSYRTVDCINVGDGVSTTLVLYERSLYVATAKELSWIMWCNFFTASSVIVDASSFLPVPSSTESSPPSRVAVNLNAWDAFCKQQQPVLSAVHDVASRFQRDGTPLTSIVFCGHGFGAAVAQLLTAAWDMTLGMHALPSSLITFGCPSVGDAACQVLVPARTWHQRVFVEHDPIAGLPRARCSGLSLSPNVAQYAAVQAHEHWVLSISARARESGATTPLVPSLSVAGIAFGFYHRLSTYAECLKSHYASAGVDAAGSKAAGPPTEALIRRGRRSYDGFSGSSLAVGHGPYLTKGPLVGRDGRARGRFGRPAHAIKVEEATARAPKTIDQGARQGFVGDDVRACPAA